MIESFREEVVNFKRDLKAELHEMKQSVPITCTDPQLPDQQVSITDAHHLLLQNQSSHPRMDLPESTPEHSLVICRLISVADTLNWCSYQLDKYCNL
jgi:hypothetical protein